MIASRPRSDGPSVRARRIAEKNAITNPPAWPATFRPTARASRGARGGDAERSARSSLTYSSYARFGRSASPGRLAEYSQPDGSGAERRPPACVRGRCAPLPEPAVTAGMALSADPGAAGVRVPVRVRDARGRATHAPGAAGRRFGRELVAPPAGELRNPGDGDRRDAQLLGLDV